MKNRWNGWKTFTAWLALLLGSGSPWAISQEFQRPVATNDASRDAKRTGSGIVAPVHSNRANSANIGTVDWRHRDEQYAQLSEEVDLLERQTMLLRRAVRLVNPTVVHIEAIKEENAADTPRQEWRPETKGAKTESRKVEEAGSGVVVQIGSGNFILTNRHVIQSAALQNIRVETFEGIPLKVERVWEDPSTDLAVIDVGRRDLPIARIGDSRNLEMGDHVFAVGSPFGLNHSVSYGIVSAKGRRNLELGSKSIVYQDFIQTDAAINPGNSGGPLMSMRGEVVGINTAIASNSGGNEGIGFAIPINIAMNVAKQLVERGTVQRSYLGVSVERAFNIDSGVGAYSQRPRGAFVKVIKPNSPAEMAGIRYGDIILEFDGTLVDNDEHLVQLVGLTPFGRPIEVIVLRETSRLRIPVELVASPSPQ
ncbi:MAG: S1C family serine protease [Pirellula sp.]